MKIVIFDMDGTLLDSKKDITISIDYIRKEHLSNHKNRVHKPRDILNIVL